MKHLIATTIAALLLGATAASAAPFHGHGPRGHYDVVRHVPDRHIWVRGERFIPGVHRYAVVDDWRPFQLRRPTYGFSWIRAGGNFLLVNNRTGRIVDVRFDRF